MNIYIFIFIQLCCLGFIAGCSFYRGYVRSELENSLLRLDLIKKINEKKKIEVKDFDEFLKKSSNRKMPDLFEAVIWSKSRKKIEKGITK